MRGLWVMGVTACLCGGATASDESRDAAAKAVGFFAALAYQCDDLVEADLKAEARTDAILTLQAGGYSEPEANDFSVKLFNTLDETWKPTSEMPASMCQAMSGSIMDGRPAMRAELDASR